MSTLSYRPEIDGLRAIAILSVFTFHINESWLSGGFIGVDIFFVISGFLIASIVLANSSQTAKEFLLRRAKRILPAYGVMLLAILLIGVAVMPLEHLYQLSKRVAAALFQISNLTSLSKDPYFASESLNSMTLHTWSLGVEWQFYCLVALFLSFAKSNYSSPTLARAIIAVSIASLLFAFFVSFNDDPKWNRHAYYNPFSRLWEFSAGIFVAVLMSNGVTRFSKPLGTTGVVLILLGVNFIPSSTEYPGYLAFVPVFGTAMLIYGAQTPGLLKHILSLPWLTAIGRLSYSLYLWHWPVLAFTRYFSASNELSWTEIVISILLTSVLSVISYRLIERRQHYAWDKTKYTFAIVFSACVVFIPTRGLSLMDSERLEQTKIKIACNSVTPNSCGAHGSKLKVLLIGDSHAGHFGATFKDIAETRGWILTVKHSSACPPLIPDELSQSKQSKCGRLQEYLRKYSAEYDKIILSARWELYATSNVFQKQLKKTLKLIESDNNDVNVLEQAPSYKKIPRALLEVNQRYGTNFKTPISIANNWITANQQVKEVTDKLPSIHLVPTSEFFCVSSFCSPFINHTLAYRDNDHINVWASRKMSTFFENSLVTQQVN